MTSHISGTALPFELTQHISQGGQGMVWRALRTDRNELIAVKGIPLALDKYDRKKEVNKLDNTFHDVMQLDHKNVVKHLQTQNPYDELAHVMDIPRYYVLMEYCAGGTLHDAARYKAPAFYVQKSIREVLHGLQYVHRNRIIHRDIKRANILMTANDRDNCETKIADLGDIKRLLSEMTAAKEVSVGHGTSSFMSPEINGGKMYKDFDVGRKTDIWSLGCVVIEVLTGHAPVFIRREEGKETVLKTDGAVRHFVGNDGGLPEIPAGLPADLNGLVLRCIKVDPKKSPSADQLLQTDLFLTAVDMRSLTYPDNRPEHAGAG